MSVMSQEITSNFTKMSNVITNDKNISGTAKFIYNYMASKPSKWSLTLKGMDSQMKESIPTILKYIKELVKAGYCEKHKHREGNRQAPNTYILHEKPISVKEDSVVKEPTNTIVEESISIEEDSVVEELTDTVIEEPTDTIIDEVSDEEEIEMENPEKSTVLDDLPLEELDTQTLNLVELLDVKKIKTSDDMKSFLSNNRTNTQKMNYQIPFNIINKDENDKRTVTIYNNSFIFVKDRKGVLNTQKLKLQDTEEKLFLCALMKEKSIFSLFKILPIKKKKIREFFHISEIKNFIDMKKFLFKHNKDRNGKHHVVSFSPNDKRDKRLVSFNSVNNIPYFRTDMKGNPTNNGANLSFAEADIVYKQLFANRNKNIFTDLLNTLLVV